MNSQRIYERRKQRLLDDGYSEREAHAIAIGESEENDSRRFEAGKDAYLERRAEREKP